MGGAECDASVFFVSDYLLELASLPVSSPSLRVASRTPFYCIRDHVRAMVVEDIEHFQEDAAYFSLVARGRHGFQLHWRLWQKYIASDLWMKILK